MMKSCVLYAVLSSFVRPLALPSPKPASAGAVEVVDLLTLETINSFSVGSREPSALALVGTDLYIVDPANDELAVFSTDGRPIAAVTLPQGATDCVGAPDGSRVYVISGEAIAIVDTATRAIADHIPITADATSGIAVSDSGATVCAIGRTSGNATAYLLDAASLTVKAVTLTGSAGPIVGGGADVAFAENGMALVTAGNSLVAIDASTESQVPGGSVTLTGADLELTMPGTLQYSSDARRAVIVDYVDESFEPFFPAPVPIGQLQLVNPITKVISTSGNLGLPPQLIQMEPDGGTLLVVQGHEVQSPDRDLLSFFDVSSMTFRGARYTFSSDLFVTDMQVWCPAGLPTTGWPMPKWPLRGSGEGLWFFIDPLWDPLRGIAANVGFGLGGALGRWVARTFLGRSAADRSRSGRAHG